MNTNNVLRFLSWTVLTYMWLESNRLFFIAIADAINNHNEQIRLKRAMVKDIKVIKGDVREMLVEIRKMVAEENLSSMPQ